MHIAEVVTIAKSLPLLRLNTYKSLILSYSADLSVICVEKIGLEQTLYVFLLLVCEKTFTFVKNKKVGVQNLYKQ